MAFDLEKLMPEDFEAAIFQHIEQPSRAAAWRKMIGSSEALSIFAIGCARKYDLDPQLIASIFMAGIDAGVILADKSSRRRIEVVHL